MKDNISEILIKNYKKNDFNFFLPNKAFFKLIWVILNEIIILKQKIDTTETEIV